jgi:membrane-associated phospholipid phosphatase
MELAHSTPGRRTLLLGLGAATLVLTASLADSWAFAHLSLPSVYDQGWGRLLRTLGYLPFWLLVGFAFYRSTTTPSGRRQAMLLMGTPTLSGALSELFKLLVRRERPSPNAGLYVFRAFSDRPFSTAGFGMPSGDVIVAFAACTILARVWPRTRVLWYGLAVGCAIARVLSRAHFLSDVTVAGILGWVIADQLWKRFAPPSTAPEPSPAT